MTGSTLFRALGRGSLKEQQQHFHQVIKKQTAEISPEFQTFIDYGTTNEFNALATMVAKILPVYHPGSNFVEGEC